MVRVIVRVRQRRGLAAKWRATTIMTKAQQALSHTCMFRMYSTTSLGNPDHEKACDSSMARAPRRNSCGKRRCVVGSHSSYTEPYEIRPTNSRLRRHAPHPQASPLNGSEPVKSVAQHARDINSRVSTPRFAVALELGLYLNETLILALNANTDEHFHS